MTDIESAAIDFATENTPLNTYESETQLIYNTSVTGFEHGAEWAEYRQRKIDVKGALDALASTVYYNENISRELADEIINEFKELFK